MTDKEFQAQIYQLLQSIPSGKITSYGPLAAMAGHPARARMVGKILRDLPAGSRLPWFKVLSANGKPAFPPGSESFERQAALLLAAGITLDENHRAAPLRWWPES